jgi:hypothetical protein
VCETRTHYFHRRKLTPAPTPPGTIALDATAGVFKRAHKEAPLAQPTDGRKRKIRPGSIATIGEIIASK